MLYTQPHIWGHDIMHFCREIYKAERLERGKKEEPAQNRCEFWGCLAAPSHRAQLQGCVGQPFFRAKKSGLLWDKGLSLTTSRTSLHLLPNLGTQSTPLPPFSSMLTCWNSFKSSTHWCNTPSWRLSACTLVQHINRKSGVQYLLPRYKNRSTPSTVIVFPLGIRCRNTNKPFNAGKKALPCTAMTLANNQQLTWGQGIGGGHSKHQVVLHWGLTWIHQDTAFSVKTWPAIPTVSKTHLHSILYGYHSITSETARTG